MCRNPSRAKEAAAGVPSAGIAFLDGSAAFFALLTNPQVRTPRCRREIMCPSQQGESPMPTFILSLNWTDQGIRAVKDAPKRSAAARELAKKVGVDIKQVYLTSGESDLLLIVDTANGD